MKRIVNTVLISKIHFLSLGKLPDLTNLNKIMPNQPFRVILTIKLDKFV